jgi:universal stress protein E
MTAQQTTLEQVAALAKDTAREQAAALTKDYDIDDDHIHIREGVPWEVLTGLGDDLNVRCFVLGTMGRTGIAGKLIGNTAEKVIHHTKKDLLVISPS